jgi:hypothetical protein
MYHTSIEVHKFINSSKYSCVLQSMMVMIYIDDVWHANALEFFQYNNSDMVVQNI